jgi:hypothetical protein
VVWSSSPFMGVIFTIFGILSLLLLTGIILQR